MKFLTALTSEFEAGFISPNENLKSISSTTQKWQPSISAENNTLVLTCFEEDDDVKTAKEVANRIESIHKRAGSESTSITLVPFAHLSNRAMIELDQVDLLLNILQRTLSRRGIEVGWISPNSSNVLFSKLLIFDKMQTVRLGTSESSLRRTLMSLVRAFGPQKVLSVIGSILALKGISNTNKSNI